ncbi:HAUS AUGMIN-LIKE COMPLEX SUBUNIT 2 [Salix koriyanagi]|uniref:HAUS AUGMIN-LIKE COMPLEX SUBUNIT 2 n=1 Tax=Salix koriyanagi TaxID=2511006 RepID=A0A9Q0TFM4_9ROSI|nr:HAUS AUGMIN-LIKE COMPLEX SUBUNIT 2 [Salix koriyanagi]
MSMSSDSTWVGKKPIRRIGGMADALSIAADLGFSVAPPPSQEELQNLSTASGEKGDDLIRVLRELTAVQRKIADLQVELQGRKDDKNVAHLTHVSEMEKKIDTLSRITTILKDVIQNKDRIISRLQQPYSLDCIPVEAEYQKQFSELLMKAASDYGALTASVADFQWSQNFQGTSFSVGGNVTSYSCCFSILYPILRSHVCHERIICHPSRFESWPFR